MVLVKGTCFHHAQLRIRKSGRGGGSLSRGPSDIRTLPPAVSHLFCFPRIRVVFASPCPCSELPRRSCGESGKDPLQPRRRPASTSPFPSWPRLSPRAGCKRGAALLLRFPERHSLRSGRQRSFSGDAGSPKAPAALLQGCERPLVSALGVGDRAGTGKIPIHPRLTSRDQNS